MTLHEATRKCLEAFREELPKRFKWRDGEGCPTYESMIPPEAHTCRNCGVGLEVHGRYFKPMPEPSDELAMALLRHVLKPAGIIFKGGMDPRDAIIFACTELISKEVP